MKRTKKTALYAAALTLAVLTGCSHVLLEKPGNDSGGEIPAGEAGALPEGFGAVAIRLTSGAARTAMPDLELALDNLFLEYWFTPLGGGLGDIDEGGGRGEDPVKIEPEGEIFVLEAGDYGIAVWVYEDADKQNLVALGTTEGMFTVSAGAVLPLDVNLRPAENDGGEGELVYALTGPAGASVEILSLTRIAGEEATIELATGGSSIDPKLSDTQSGIPAGYYLLRVVVKNSAGASAGRVAVVHIYRGLPTGISYEFIDDDFRIYRVTSADNDGPGTLREAITNAQSVDGPQTIQVMLGPGAVIELTTTLPLITKSLTIEGNGATLTRVEIWTSSGTSQLLRIMDAAAEVQIRRIHFKNGLATDYGGAVDNRGILTLESCVFSGNRVTYWGGAVYSNNNLTIRGCTFYGNTAAYNGGAIYFNASGKTLTLTGNLFYGNTAPQGLAVFRNNGSVAASYNVVDAAFGTGTGEAGWAAGTDDTPISSSDLPVLPGSFKLLHESKAREMLPEPLPPSYPDTDFYGKLINDGGAAGAAQESTPEGRYYVELSVNDGERGRIEADSEPDEDGLYPEGSRITAHPEGVYAAEYWVVNGQRSNGDFIIVSGHTWAKAMFTQTLTVDSEDDTLGSENQAGTLRYALTKAGEGDTIVFDGVTSIELKSSLPEITKSLTIEGNGATLTMAEDSWSVSNSSQLLRITGATAEALIRRLHFKNGLATTYGGAVRNSGILTLESCVFSGNRVNQAYYASGGAVYSENTLTIRGCTFYGNRAPNGNGGAVYFNASGKILTLTGNLFYGNTASQGLAVYRNNGSVDASYNVVDATFGTGDTQAGWSGGTGDKTISALPVSPRSFKLLYGSGALGKLPGDLPTDYPDTDFYDKPISGGGAAGAAQEGTENWEGYYYLELSANNSELGTFTTTPEPDPDGLYQAGVSIDITANPTAGYAAGRWLVNGLTVSAAPKSLSGHTWAQAIFGRLVIVDSVADTDTPGTLRHAVNNAEDDDLIQVSQENQAIELTASIKITKTLTIDGNGATLTRVNNQQFQMLEITNTAEALVRRLHFKNGEASGDGGAIGNSGILTLESCIFSKNQAGAAGGAVASINTLTVRGCTFYENTSNSNSGYVSGAIWFFNQGATLTLTGNLFYGNTARSVYNFAFSPVTASYNVVDQVLGTEGTQAGWSGGTEDTTITLPVSLSFKPLYGSGAEHKLPNPLPPGYPDTDFYGKPISGGGAAGAVQESTPAGYYYLDLSVNHSERGTVTPMPDADGLVPANSVITATPNDPPNNEFWYWLVNGEKSAETSTSINLSGHARIQAMFRRVVMVSNFNDAGDGSLRHALNNAEDDDRIEMSRAGQTITLISGLPAITKSLTIEGNGTTLIRGFSSNSYILSLSSGSDEALVRRLHFKDGQVENRGAAINHNSGSLTLESCIFSNNVATVYYGGAVFSLNTLTIRGCTFYGNRAGSGYGGGAIFFNAPGKTLTLTGNLFYGNTTGSYPVVRNYAGSVSASHNVVDVELGPGNTAAGWSGGTGDTTFTDLGIIGAPFDTTTFVPVTGTGLSIVLPLPAPEGFPTEDFYGTLRSFPGAPGAVAEAPSP